MGIDYYVDPLNGNINNPGTNSQPWSTLALVVANKVFNPGDKIYLKRGYHGTPFIVNSGSLNASADVYVLPVSGHSPIIRSLTLSGANHWNFKGLTITRSATPAGHSDFALVALSGNKSVTMYSSSPSNHITIENCTVYGAQDASVWSDATWVAEAGVTAGIKNYGLGNRFIGNHLYNNSGIYSYSGSTSAYVGYNTIEDFAFSTRYVDYGALLASDYSTFEYNKVMNAHSKFSTINGGSGVGVNIEANILRIGSTNTNPRTIIRNNELIAFTNPKQAHLNTDWTSATGPTSRIYGIFGSATTTTVYNYTIENNLVAVDHTYGIYLKPSNSKIINNTVVRAASGSVSIPLITVVINTGVTTVYNNIAEGFAIPVSNITSGGNYVLNYNDGNYATNLVKFNFANDFSAAYRDAHLTSGALTLINAGISGSSIPTIDLDGTLRSGNPDVGAFEYSVSNNAPDITSPSQPIGLISRPISGYGVDLSWTAPVSAEKVDGYYIFRNGTRVGNVRTKSTTNFLVLDPAASGTYTIQSFDKFYNVSTLSNGITAGPDLIAPSTPTLSAGTLTTSSAQLLWDAATDNFEVVAYNVYRDSNLLATVVDGVLNYTDTTIVSNSSYNYTLKAKDAYNNLSDASNIVNIITSSSEDLVAPSVPTGLSVSTLSSTSTYITWNASTDNIGGVGLAGYILARNLIEITGSTQNYYTDTGLSENIVYTYKVKSFDLSGNTSAYSTTQTITTGRTLQIPQNFAVINSGPNSISISWDATTDIDSNGSYNIYSSLTSDTSGFSLRLSGIAYNSNDVNDTGLNSGVTYYYKIRALDGLGNISNFSDVSYDTTTDTELPSSPVLSTGTITPTSVNLIWTSSTDNVAVVSYNVYRNSSIITSVTGLSYLNIGLTQNTPYIYNVAAVDSSNNESVYSNSITATTTVPITSDITGPTTPSLSGQVSSSSSISLSWNASTDNVAVSGYNVYRNSFVNPIAFTTGLSYSDTGLIDNTEYVYKVKSKDTSNNESSFSNIITLTTSAGVTTTQTEFYVNPLIGNINNPGTIRQPWNTLADVVNAKTFNPGDRIYLYRGYHGTPYISSGNIAASADVYVLPMPGHTPVIRSLTLRNANRWNFKGLTISRANTPSGHADITGIFNANKAVTTYTGVGNNSSYITIENCTIYGAQDTSSWTDTNWITEAGIGTGIKNYGLGNTFRGNHLYNIGGIESYSGSTSAYIGHNIIEDFAIGTTSTAAVTLQSDYATFEYNKVLNAHTKFATVNSGNNTEGRMLLLGASSTNPISYIKNNEFIAFTNPKQAHLSRAWNAASGPEGRIYGIIPSATGTSAYNVSIENNIIIIDHPYGIYLKTAGTKSRINFNTILRATSGSQSGVQVPIITILSPTYGTSAFNNVAENFVIPVSNMISGGNIALNYNAGDYTTNFANFSYANDYSYARRNAHLTSGALTLLNTGKSSGNLPNTDADGTLRDVPPDVGAYEYTVSNGVPDITSPSQPTGLTVIPISGYGADLSWTSPVSADKVDGYYIFKDSVKVGNVRTKNVTNFLVYNSSVAGTYTIQAFDKYYNTSTLSDAVVVTPDTTPPASPTNLQTSALSQTKVIISWTGSSDGSGSGVIAYALYRNGVNFVNVTPNISGTESYSDTGLLQGTQYTYNIRAIDASNNYSNYSSDSIVTTISDFDSVAPSVPENLTAVTTSISGSYISWNASTDNYGFGVTAYDLYRMDSGGPEYTLISTIPSSSTSYNDSGLSSETHYTYKATAKDQAGNISDFSNISTILTYKLVNSPENLDVSIVSILNNIIYMNWDAPTVGASGVDFYDVYRNINNTQYDYLVTLTSNITEYTDNSPISGSSAYTYGVKSKDISGNVSEFSNLVTIIVPDIGVPSTPSLSATTISPTAVYLNWTNSSDNVAVIDYELVRDISGSNVVTVSNISATSYYDLDGLLLPLTTYNYKVRARDAANNYSNYSNSATVTTPSPIVFPNAPTGLLATLSGSNSTVVTWNAATVNVGGSLVSSYELYRNNFSTAIVNTSGIYYFDTGLLSDSTYTYKVKSVDVINNKSDFSNSSTVNTPLSASPRLTEYYIDPLIGKDSNDGSINSPWKTFAEVVSSQSFQAEDTIYLARGYHGCPDITQQITGGKVLVTPMQGHTPIFGKLRTFGAWNWTIDGITITSKLMPANAFIPTWTSQNAGDGNAAMSQAIILGALANSGKASTNITIQNCTIYGAQNVIERGSGYYPSQKSTMTTLRGTSPSQYGSYWMERIGNGIEVGLAASTTQACTNAKFIGNHLRNYAGFMLDFKGNTTTISGNIIEGATSDAMHVTQNGTVIVNNKIQEMFKVTDSNHNDMIQFRGTVSDIKVQNNELRSLVNPFNPYLPSGIVNYAAWAGNTSITGNYFPYGAPFSDVQGIGGFDGGDRHIITNNIVMVDHPIGIWLEGSDRSLIANNTVIRATSGYYDPHIAGAYSPLCTSSRPPGIRIGKKNSGGSYTGAGSTNCSAFNNISEHFELSTGTSVDGGIGNGGVAMGAGPFTNNYTIDMTSSSQRNKFMFTGNRNWSMVKNLHLKSTAGATVLNVGLTTPSTPILDKEGNIRLNPPDLGAYEQDYTLTETAAPSTAPVITSVIGISAYGVDIQWTASPVQEKVEGYYVYKNLIKVGTVRAKNTTRFFDVMITTPISASYTVKSFNEYFDESPSSAEYLWFKDVTAPSAPVITAATALSKTRSLISFTDSTDNVDVLGYYIYRDGILVNSIPSYGDSSYIDTNLTAGTTYDYYIITTDTYGNISSPSNTVNITTTSDLDTESPTTPTNVTAEAISISSAYLTWTKSIDNINGESGVIGYVIAKNIKNDISLIESTITGSNFGAYTDIGLTPGTTYEYRIKAIDQSFNYSSYSQITSGSTVTLPTIILDPPTDLIAEPINSSEIDLSWTAPAYAVLTYTMFRADGINNITFDIVGRSTGDNSTVTNYVDRMSLVIGNSYTYKIFATDLSGNISDFSNEATAITPDDLAPTLPSISAGTITPSSVQIMWHPSVDNFGVAGYDIYRDNSIITTITGNSYTDVGLTNGTEYTYAIDVFDINGNYSVLSNVLTISTLDNEPPSTPVISVGTITTSSIQVLWDASTDNIAISGYDIYRGTSSIVYIASTTDTSYTNTGLSVGTSYTYRIKAKDISGNATVYSNAITASTLDNVVPSTPVISAGTVTPTSAQISWTASTDNVAVSGYDIYRDTFTTPVTSITGISYTDTTLVPSVTYTYKIKSKDTSNNFSSFSNTVIINTLDNVAPSTPVISAGTINATSVQILWNASTDNTAVSGYDIYRNTFTTPITSIVGTSYTDSSLITTTTYVYKIKSKDTSNNFSVFSNAITATTLDNVVPSTPVISAGTITPATINIHWNASTDNVAVSGYDIYRDTFTTPITSITGTSYTDSGLISTTQYVYKIKSKDTSNNFSVFSNAISSTTLDNIVPSTPVISAGTVSATSVQLLWTASTDNVAVSGYDIYRNTFTTPITSIVGTSYNNIGLTSAITYIYKIKSKDTSNNFSVFSNAITATTLDTVAPTAPSISAGTITPTSANILWTASTDNVSVSGYDIYRDTFTTPVTSIIGTSYTDNSLIANNSYTYKVKAKDTSNNFSNFSNTLSLNTLDTNAPTTPTISAGTISATSAQILWDASTDNTAVSGYSIYRDDFVTPIAFTTNLTYNDITLTNGTAYTYKVKAKDTTFNDSGFSNTLIINTLDTTAPTAPTISFGTISATTIYVNWAASTDNVSVSGYDIYRDTFTTPITSIVGTSYADSGLISTTRYVYKVKSKDTSNNFSVFSNAITATTLDNIAPSTPSISSAMVTATVISIHWTASTDNVAVSGYDIYRDTFTTPITSITGTSFVNFGLTNGTSYTYKVKAKDTSNNFSDFSNTLTLTTLDNEAPTIPTIFAGTTTISSATINWNASTDNVGVSGYYVYRLDLFPTPVGFTTDTTFTDSPLADVTTYVYSVIAIDAAGNNSNYNEISLTTLDNTPPSVPSISAYTITTSSIYLSWNASTDNVAVSGYDIYRDTFTTPITSITGTSFVNFGLTNYTTYTYKVKAKDTSNNFSDFSNTLVQTTLDGVPPSIPSISAGTVTPYDIQILWNASTDTAGVSGYTVYKNNEFQTFTTDTFYNDVALTNGTNYSYKVSSMDIFGNTSDISNILIVRTLDNENPSDPTIYSGSITPSSIQITWDVSIDNVAVSGYDIYRDMVNVASVQSPLTTYTDINLDNFTTYNYFIIAKDMSNNFSNNSNELVLTTLDNQPPSTPAISAGTITPSSINLMWEISSDNNSMSGYNVYRNDVLLGFIFNNNNASAFGGFTPIQEYLDDNLGNGELHTYKITAIDSSINISPFSNILTLRTIDTESPTTPILSGGNVTQSSAHIYWTVSTDNVAVSGYDIYRDGAQIAFTTNTSYNDSGLNEATSYAYKIKAKDASNNYSEFSNSIITTTIDVTPPSIPINVTSVAVSGFAATISWNSSTDNAEIKGYNIYRNGVLIAFVPR